MHPDKLDETAPVPVRLTVLLCPDTTVTQVLVAGELDLATELVLLAAADRLRAAGPDRVLLDLTRLSFCDARGLAALAALHDRLDRAGVRLTVTDASPRLRWLLAITGLDRHLDLRPGATTHR